MADTPKILGELGQTSAARKAAEFSGETADDAFRRKAEEQKRGAGGMAYDYMKGAAKAGMESYLEGLKEQGLAASGLLGIGISRLLKGTADVSQDITKTLPIDNLRKIPSIKRVNDLTLRFTKIKTGLGFQVDQVLQRSQDELASAVTKTYDTLKTNVHTLQKSIVVLDKNVRIVDVRQKQFQTDTDSNFKTLQTNNQSRWRFRRK